MLIKFRVNLKFVIILLATFILVVCVHLFYTYCLLSSTARYKLMKESEVTLNDKRDVKYVVFWTTFFDIPYWCMNNKTYYQDDLKTLGCPKTNCIFTHKKDLLRHHHDYDAVVFYGAEAWKFIDLPETRSPHQVYIMGSLESPGEIKHNLKLDQNFYNLTMTYRLDSDIGWFYGSILDLSTNKVISPAMNINWRVPDNDFYDSEMFNIAQRKTKTAAWFVSHCNAHSNRDRISQELQQYIDVDIYGKCGTLSCPRDSSLCNEMLNSTYKFYFAFENTICVDYVTEKLFSVMNNYIIPVTLNGAEMSRFIPPKSYIDINDFESVAHLASHLQFLSENPREYIKYFWWKNHYKVTTKSLRDGQLLCGICRKLNEINFSAKRQVYENIKDWFYKGTCRKATIKF